MKIFPRIYVRLFLETFTVVLMTSMNELRFNKKKDGAQIFSYMIAWIVMLAYLALYCLVIYLCMKEMIRRVKLNHGKIYPFNNKSESYELASSSVNGEENLR